jgi:phage tail-like protein
MPTIINNRGNLATDPVRNFRFLVTFRPHDQVNGPKFSSTIGFTSVSGLSVNTEAIPYREGGYNSTVHMLPGQTTFAPITMQRGVTINSRQNWDWMKHLFSVVGGSGSTGSVFTTTKDFRVNVDIAVLSHPSAGSAVGTGSMLEQTASGNDFVTNRFRVYNAWITSLAYSDLNAGDNALFVEQITLAHEGFDHNWAPSLTGSGAPKF